MSEDAGDLRDGRYIHRGFGTRTMAIVVDGEAQEWVHADDFMDVQKERDDYRRAMALVNAWRWSPDFVNGRVVVLDRLLTGVGFTMDDARAMNAIIAEARTWNRNET